MTPYTKQIVELHKIHKAIENCGCNKDDEQGGDVPTEITMYDAWMKAFNEFKVYQDDNDNNNVLTVTPAICIIKDDGSYDTKESDEEISLAFMNRTTQQYKEYTDDSEVRIYDIKDIPDDIYEQALGYSSSYISFLYDLDELNRNANNIIYAVEAISIHHRTSSENVVSLLKGRANYVPNSGVYKINGKYYVHFPGSMD